MPILMILYFKCQNNFYNEFYLNIYFYSLKITKPNFLLGFVIFFINYYWIFIAVITFSPLPADDKLMN